MLNQHKHFRDHGLEFRKRIVGAELAKRVRKNIRVSISDQTARVAILACSLGLGVQFQDHGSGATLRLFSKRAMYRIEDSLHRGVTLLPA